MKRGRPKKVNKASNRVHSIVLTEKAEQIYRLLENKQGTKWFSKWISKMLCIEFPIDNEEHFWLKEMLRRQKEMHEKQDSFEEAREKLVRIRKSKGDKNKL